jgi:hypothetical protein
MACPAWMGPSVLLRDYSDRGLWCLLQCERAEKARIGAQYSDDLYLANIETEWSRRNVCSHCFGAMAEGNPPAGELLQRIKVLEEENASLREQLARPGPRFGFGT